MNAESNPDARELALSYAPAAVECLHSIMLDVNASPDAKVEAATAMLRVAGMMVDIVEER